MAAVVTFADNSWCLSALKHLINVMFSDTVTPLAVRAEVDNSGFSTAFKPVLGLTQPPIQWIPGIKRPGREADHSPPTSAGVRNTWIYTSIPPHVFMS
jgi:hypothetical protein